METRFLIPVTIATAFHALVFFGAKWQHPSVEKPIEPVSVVAVRPERIEVALEPEERSERDVATVPPKGEPEQPISQPDFLSEQRSIFEQPIRMEIPVTKTLVDRLPNAPIGVPDGEGVDWKGVDIFSTRDLENTPRTRSQVAPVYPAAERSAGIPGEVLVEFTVDETGRVLNPRVIRSSQAAFETPTLRAVEKWRFEPGKVRGKAVRFRMMIPVKFSLND